MESGDHVNDTATYLHPLSEATAAALDASWQSLVSSNGGREAPTSVPILFGRRLHVERAAGRAARFMFEELCGCPRGSPDYIAVAEHFDFVVLDEVPALSMQVRLTGLL